MLRSLMWAAAILLLPFAVGAQQRGDLVLTAGGVYTHTFGASGPVHTNLRNTLAGRVLGIQDSFDSPGTRVLPGDSATLLLGGSLYLGPHVALVADAGLPPRFDIRGQGVVAPTGIAGRLFNVDLGVPASNPLASVREWSPATLLLYRFDESDDWLRPHLAIGLTYIWYSGIRLDPDFAADLQTNFGRVLAVAAGKPGTTTIRTQTSRQFAPVFNAGLSLALSGPWTLSASASFVPTLATTAHIDLYAADGTALSSSSVRIKLRPLLGSLLLSYRFGCPLCD
jgi:outer membrane protein